MRAFLGALLVGLTLTCAWPSMAAQGPWFAGSVEDAFALAKKEGKPIFLYWGAVWCPPCNEIKSQVFSQPRFAELTRPVVAVYLDGDSDAAQLWGERLKASGYPTLLLLNAQGEELLRLNSAVSMAEFEQAFSSALAFNAPLEKVLGDLRQGKGDVASWRALAHADWEEAKTGAPWSDDELLALKYELYQHAPASLAAVKAVLAAGLFEYAAALSQQAAAGKTPRLSAASQKLLGQLQAQGEDLLGVIFKNDETIMAARGFVMGQAGKAMAWVGKAVPAPQQAAWVKRWTDAAAFLRTNPQASPDTRLWAVYPLVDLYLAAKGADAVLPKATVEAVQAAVKRADLEAKTPFERQAVISGAAYLLQKVKDYAGAERLLTKELKVTAAPWYYELSLAHLAKEQGQKEQALAWADKARLSAKGEATRLQWTVHELALVAELGSDGEPRKAGQLAALSREYYELAFAKADGFHGRNGSQAKRVAAILAPLAPQDAGLTKALQSYQGRCKDLPLNSQAACQEHFKQILR